MVVSNQEFAFAVLQCLQVSAKSAIDFEKVAEICGYKSAAVASTRFGQIKKEISQKNGGGSSPAKASPAKTPKSRSSKKRKMETFDDLEREPSLSPTPVKREPRSESKAVAGSKRKLKELIKVKEDESGTGEEDHDYGDSPVKKGSAAPSTSVSMVSLPAVPDLTLSGGSSIFNDSGEE